MSDDTDKQVSDQPLADDKATDAPAADAPMADAPADDQATAPVSDDQGQQASSTTDKYGRQLFSATCSGCGNQAQVPFKPTDGRPVYCRDCFMKQRNSR